MKEIFDFAMMHPKLVLGGLLGIWIVTRQRNLLAKGRVRDNQEIIGVADTQEEGEKKARAAAARDGAKVVHEAKVPNSTTTYITDTKGEVGSYVARNYRNWTISKKGNIKGK